MSGFNSSGAGNIPHRIQPKAPEAAEPKTETGKANAEAKAQSKPGVTGQPKTDAPAAQPNRQPIASKAASDAARAALGPQVQTGATPTKQPVYPDTRKLLDNLFKGKDAAIAFAGSPAAKSLKSLPDSADLEGLETLNKTMETDGDEMAANATFASVFGDQSDKMHHVFKQAALLG